MVACAMIMLATAHITRVDKVRCAMIMLATAHITRVDKVRWIALTGII